MKRPIAVVLLLSVSGVVAPLAAANREHLQLMADIRMLQEQTQQLQLILGSLTEALQLVTAKLEEQSTQTRKAFADQKLLVDNLAGDVRIVRERLDETNVRITSLSQELEALRVAIPPSSPTPPDSTSPMSPTAPPGPTAQPPSTQPVNPGMTPKRLFDTAQADYFAAQWSLAIAGFQAYLKSFPKGELADDAQLLIGESYFGDNRFGDAVAAYDAVIANYPGSNSVPDAYYKKGVALQRLGQVDRAREALEFVVKNYPDSDAGRLAAQLLKRPRPPGD